MLSIRITKAHIISHMSHFYNFSRQHNFNFEKTKSHEQLSFHFCSSSMTFQAFEKDQEVCILYNIDMGGQAEIFTCGWYKVEHGKIKRLKVVLDPRPLLSK